MTITSFLREADFVVTIFTNVAVLFVAFPAYRRTKLLPFALFIWGGFVGVILSAALHIHRTRGFISTDDERQFQELYRVGYIVGSILWTAGVVLLVRHFMAQFARKDDHVA
jgi:signal transduction histidine kinase